mmetsp:Transcript_18298/g.21047  ORF Transcript_18298/g.21047 Transcript_18298/m.21047 type:complete len:93 (-) Transcript_18298:24-302(-)
MWGLWFIINYKATAVSTECQSSLKIQLTYYHSWMYFVAFLYCFTIFLLAFLYKAAHIFTHMKFPNFYHKVFLNKRDEVVEKYIDEFWNHHKY